MARLQRAVDSLLERPEQSLSPWGRRLQRVVAMVVYCGKELQRDKAQQLAAALTYRTIFSLVPVLVMSLLVLRAISGGQGVQEPLSKFLSYAGLDELRIQTVETKVVDEQGNPLLATEQANGEKAIGEWLQDLVTQVSASVESLNFTAIALIGALVLVYAALSMLFEIERAFNTVYAAESRRSVIARITNSWAILTLGPIGLLVSFYVGQQLQEFAVAGGGPLASVSGVAVTFCISWLLLLFGYRVIPATRVRLQPALIGAFVAAALWEMGKIGFAQYVSFSTGYSRYYGSLGLLPIFLLWVYITWLVVLFGLEITYALQTHSTAIARARLSAERQRHAGAITDPAIAVRVLVLLADRFRQGKHADAGLLSRLSGASERAVEKMLSVSVERGYLVPVEGESARSYTFAMPPERIPATEALQVGFALAHDEDASGKSLLDTLSRVKGSRIKGAEAKGAREEEAVGVKTLRRLREAQLQALEGLTLADLASNS